MLKVLRKKGVAKKILIGLAIIIIPAFVLWGSGSMIRSRKGPNYAGVIFGKKIDFDQYNNSLLACKNQAIMMYGDNFYKMQKFLNLKAEAWDRLILLHEAKRRKIKVTDSEIIERISKYPFFQKDGKFDNKIYQHLLDYVFKAPARKFEEETRKVIMLEKLFNQITKAVSVKENELFEDYKKENEKARVSFIYLSPDMFIQEITLDDEEIKDYFQKHKEEFRMPPTVNIQYFGLDYPKESKETDKSIVINKMKEIVSKMKRAGDFENISKAEELPIKETGHFAFKGPVPDIGWSYQFIQTAFNLGANQISEPIKTQKGCYILKLKEKKDSYIPDIKETKEKISNTLKQKKAKELAKTKAKEYLQTILEIYRTTPKELDLDELAQQWHAKAEQAPLFNRQSYIPNIGISKVFTDVAFALKDKEEPFDVVTTERGTFIIRLEEYIPVDKDRFLKDKESFKTKILKNKKNEFFNNFFEDLKKEARLIDNVNLPEIPLP